MMEHLNNLARFNDKTGKFELVCPHCNTRLFTNLSKGTQLVTHYLSDSGCGKQFVVKLEEKVERHVTTYKFEEVK